MAVYHGVVRHNQVDLDSDAGLADGVRVEVRPVGHVLCMASTDTPESTATADTSEAEQAFWHDLIAEGLIAEQPAAEDGPDEPFEPVRVRGRPLSEDIIEARR